MSDGPERERFLRADLPDDYAEMFELVLGDPACYGRFGFSAARVRGLDAPFSGPAFRVLELSLTVLEGVLAKVCYGDSFGLDPRELCEQ